MAALAARATTPSASGATQGATPARRRQPLSADHHRLLQRINDRQVNPGRLIPPHKRAGFMRRINGQAGTNLTWDEYHHIGPHRKPVRDWPLCRPPPDPCAGQRPVDEPFLPSEKRGITVEFLLWFLREHQDFGHMRHEAHQRASLARETQLPEEASRQQTYADVYNGSESDPLQIKTVHVCYDCIVPLTRTFENCRVFELPHIRNDSRFAQWVGHADYFVSHAWGAPFDFLVSNLWKHSARIAKETGRAPYYWIDLFAVCQHGGTVKKKEDLGQLPEASYTSNSGSSRNKGIEGVISRVNEGLVLIMADWELLSDSDYGCNPFTRTWCLFELWVARVLCDKQSIRVLSNNQLGKVTLLQVMREMRFEDTIAGIDLSQADTGRPEDQEYIMGRVQCAIEDINVAVRQVVKEATLEIMADLLREEKYRGSQMLMVFQGFLRSLCLKSEEQTQEDKLYAQVYRERGRQALEANHRERQEYEAGQRRNRLTISNSSSSSSTRSNNSPFSKRARKE